MKLLNTSMAILFAASLLTACGGKDKKEDAKTPADKLEGTWEIKRAEGILNVQHVGAIYEFKGNKVTCREQGFIIPGTTLINDSTFTFQIDGQEMKSLYKYHFNGDTLVVVPPNNVGQVFYMIKK
jgi:hypothetical protein